ncbi:hypothetical protein [Nocardia panacis]|nr:hypothetical protein [Nocardia panacis]
MRHITLRITPARRFLLTRTAALLRRTLLRTAALLRRIRTLLPCRRALR